MCCFFLCAEHSRALAAIDAVESLLQLCKRVTLKVIAIRPGCIFDSLFVEGGDDRNKGRWSLVIAQFSVRDGLPSRTDVDDGVAGVFTAGGVVRITGEQQRRVRIEGHGPRVEGSKMRRSMGRAFLTGTVPSGRAGGVLQIKEKQRINTLKRAELYSHQPEGKSISRVTFDDTA